MKHELENIRNALEEHLRAINENTDEIQVLFDYLRELEVKMEKVSQRLDQLQLNSGPLQERITVSPLNQTEKKLFLVFYTEESPLTFGEIAQKSQVSLSLVPECVSTLIQKGIPLERSFCDNQFFFRLQPQFKELQAKENLINLSLQSFM